MTFDGRSRKATAVDTIGNPYIARAEHQPRGGVGPRPFGMVSPALSKRQQAVSTTFTPTTLRTPMDAFATTTWSVSNAGFHSAEDCECNQKHAGKRVKEQSREAYISSMSTLQTRHDNNFDPQRSVAATEKNAFVPTRVANQDTKHFMCKYHENRIPSAQICRWQRVRSGT